MWCCLVLLFFNENRYTTHTARRAAEWTLSARPEPQVSHKITTFSCEHKVDEWYALVVDLFLALFDGRRFAMTVSHHLVAQCVDFIQHLFVRRQVRYQQLNKRSNNLKISSFQFVFVQLSSFSSSLSFNFSATVTGTKHLVFAALSEKGLQMGSPLSIFCYQTSGKKTAWQHVCSRKFKSW